jgi:hypothetical protein
MKIKSIKIEKFTGYVYNLELKTNSEQDDLFWVEGNTGVITHNCFPKDLSALLHLTKELGTISNVLEATQKTNDEVRENRDWEKMKGRAVV